MTQTTPIAGNQVPRAPASGGIFDFRPVWTLVLSIVVILSACTAARAGGMPYSDGNLTFGPVQIEWADSVPTRLATAVEQRAKETFQGVVDQRRFADATYSLLELLADEGYHRVAAAPRDFVVDGGALGFRLEIDPGPPLLIGGWRFTGLTRTDTTWLAAVLNLPTGVVWTRSLADRISRRLHSFAYIAAAGSPLLESGPTDSTVVVVVPLKERNPATIDGMLAASSVDGTSASRQLTGRLTVGLSGLFRRDRSVRLRYEKPHPTGTLFRLNLREAGAFGHPLDWQLAIEEWDRLDHRQTVAATLGYGVGGHDLRIEWRGRLVRVTPGGSATAPARTGELSLGLSSGPPHDAARRLLRSLTAWEFYITYSHRRQFANDAASPEGLSQRGRLDGRLVRTWWSGRGWFGRLTGHLHWWFTQEMLAAGDEWFLGGEELLRGYEDRTLTAASGAVGSLELGRVWRRGFGLAMFGETGWLESFAADATTPLTPAGYGVAILLLARDRTGRLEIGWRDHAAWGDGIVRLSVTQGW